MGDIHICNKHDIDNINEHIIVNMKKPPADMVAVRLSKC